MANPSSTRTSSPTRSATPSPTAVLTQPLTASPSVTSTASPTPGLGASFTPSPTNTGPAAFFQQERLIQVKGLYPNPFVETMHLYFTLRVEAELDLRVYNVAGEPIWQARALGRAGSNLMKWNGDNGGGGRCASGVYVLKLTAQGVDRTRDEVWERTLVSR